ncbi:MAG: aspartate-semialdehyde dehydrogenase [Dehalococcoidia bacterium]|nr:aspartate-semialdehyde dehydrogenase [Dehalococcoidia bacterium]
MKGYRVAIVGATGLVGAEFFKVLEERLFPVAEISLLASDRSEGKELTFAGRKYLVQETSPDSFRNIDIALFSAGADISHRFAPIARESGAVVIDNSAAFRMAEDVPLVVPEVNADDLASHRGIIANPNCSTIQMVVALSPLHRVNPIQRVIVTTFQSVSGTGTAAIEELTAQTKQWLNKDELTTHVYRHPIAFNVLPEIDAFLEDGYTKEERKMEDETRKILHAPGLKITATCVRVPVFASHSEAVTLEFSRPMSPAECRALLSGASGIRVVDDPSAGLYPHARAAAGTDDTLVGRIRDDSSRPGGLVMWIVADNVRKGAALNAVQIAEELSRRDLIKVGDRK